MINILLGIQSFVFIAYLAFIISKFGILHSISLSWYRLQEKNPKQGFLFTFFCWGLAIPMMMMSAYIDADTSTLIMLSGGGLVFTGSAAAFKSKDAKTDLVHFIGAATAIISGLLGIGLIYNNFVPMVIVALATILAYMNKLKNGIFWIEVIAFISIIVGLIISTN